jgi:hypothetical protein
MQGSNKLQSGKRVFLEQIVIIRVRIATPPCAKKETKQECKLRLKAAQMAKDAAGRNAPIR